MSESLDNALAVAAGLAGGLPRDWPWQALFWVSIAGIGYAYAGYPLLAAIAARRFGAPLRLEGPSPRRVSILVAARNEEARIGERVRELLASLDRAGIDGELIVVSDGSTDGTAAAARDDGDPRLRVLELPRNRGKAAALNEAAAAARFETLVLADVRQRWNDATLPRLVAPLADPTVGAVSGRLLLEERPGVLAGVGLYWRYESWLRGAESRWGSQVGVTGAVAAVRKELWQPLPEGLLLDDVCWPMRVARRGRRVVLAGDAHAFDRLPERTGGEFRRKLRTLVGNFQLVAREPWLLAPWSNPLWLQFASHKLMRLACPWAALTAIGSAAMASGPFYRFALAAQAALLCAAVLGAATPLAARSRLLAGLGSLLLLNAAAWLAFWCWALGLSGRVWGGSAYAPARE